MRSFPSIALVLLLTLAGCSSSSHMHTVAVMDTGRSETVDMSAGSAVDLELVENPSTGWTWKLQSSLDGILRSDGDRFVRDAAKEGMVGVGGKRIFTYTALKAGRVSLEFALVGPGQPVKASDHRMKVIIEVTD